VILLSRHVHGRNRQAGISSGHVRRKRTPLHREIAGGGAWPRLRRRPASRLLYQRLAASGTNGLARERSTGTWATAFRDDRRSGPAGRATHGGAASDPTTTETGCSSLPSARTSSISTTATGRFARAEESGAADGGGPQRRVLRARRRRFSRFYVANYLTSRSRPTASA
jgi:hypothetical protein